jgi:hypothetical protein
MGKKAGKKIIEKIHQKKMSVDDEKDEERIIRLPVSISSPKTALIRR